MKFKIIAGTLAFVAGVTIADAQTTPPATTPPAAGAAQRPPAGRQRGPGSLPYTEPNAPETKYNYNEAWKPFFYTKNGSEYRAADGQPGPKYWQNHVDYKINARIDTAKNEITGSEILSYSNNSPQKLDFVWMWLDQNLFKMDSR